MQQKEETTLEDAEKIEKSIGRASTPSGVEARIKLGTYLGHIRYLIKPEYIKKGCYLVYGKYLREKNAVKFEPSYYSPQSTHMVWFFTYRSGLFMSKESNKEQPVAVIWELKVDKKRGVPYGAKHKVVDITKFDYDEVKRIVSKCAVYKKQLECFWQGYSWMEPSYSGRPFKTDEKLKETTWLE